VSHEPHAPTRLDAFKNFTRVC